MFEMFKTKDDPTLGSKFYKWIGETFIGKPEDLGLGSLPDGLIRTFYFNPADRGNLERPDDELEKIEPDIIKANTYRIAALPWVNAGATISIVLFCLTLCAAVGIKDYITASASKLTHEVKSLTSKGSAQPKVLDRSSLSAEDQAAYDMQTQLCKTHNSSPLQADVDACAQVGVAIKLAPESH